MNKQLINLAGVLTVVVLLVAGIVVIALPMYSQSQTTDAQTRTVENTNSVYEQQIASLSAAEARVGEIDSDLADLRAQIATSPQLDDVHQLIAAAAEDIDAQIETVTVGDPETWLLRSIETGEGEAAATPPADASASGEEPAADGAAEGAEETATETPSAEPVAEAPSPQNQVLITIAVDVTKPFVPQGSEEDTTDEESKPDKAELQSRADRVARFVDALAVGPRLVSPVEISYTDGVLTVTVLTFFQTEQS